VKSLIQREIVVEGTDPMGILCAKVLLALKILIPVRLITL
jgi:hypothetical protein